MLHQGGEGKRKKALDAPYGTCRIRLPASRSEATFFNNIIKPSKLCGHLSFVVVQKNIVLRRQMNEVFELEIAKHT
ncbi:hypothetical protein CWI84_11540 [Idiomarina tyrosinivorans]|uniref:Uncharacterized protein n=1 Tax=Idiomarina tyrosinivorans TaxID=1445662 RepID=A0A432ZF00_9GAMM|nr:hypothetical protein CWI84_11540 [Idiomarina tyrosinivorans]